ncbi:type II secretion system protein [Ramlibacter sp. USB13]|uniref:Type II secretion system protein n=1 Tax=Ramlibacter cellulosilyticus TaxID=2764187 RepID=A0A923MSN4_9BURK|nr:type II secretion system protein [Ramlibacter cellulosilyticus]MBC5784455.1 type II secretion system protein [Ramlibacter cellulosilyticus]
MQGRRARGFTVIEMVVTVAIIGLLASIALPLAELTVQRAREHELRRSLREIRTAIDAYKQATDAGRVAKLADASGYPPSLDVLVDGVPDARDPGKRPIYFLRRLPRDPFHEAAQDRPADTWGVRAYDSPPDAPRAGKDVFDVYSRSTATGINGVPYREW